MHGILPGGGVAHDGIRWISGKIGFFLTVRVPARLLRSKKLAFLSQSSFRDHHPADRR